MTSDRPYRAALSTEEALGRLEDGAGTQFDPDVVLQAIAAIEPASRMKAESSAHVKLHVAPRLVVQCPRKVTGAFP